MSSTLLFVSYAGYPATLQKKFDRRFNERSVLRSLIFSVTQHSVSPSLNMWTARGDGVGFMRRLRLRALRVKIVAFERPNCRILLLLLKAQGFF